MSFQDSEIIARIEARLDAPETWHHRYCPMARNEKSSSCFCDRLNAADKTVEAEFRRDCREDR